jgi:hypothetical protein
MTSLTTLSIVLTAVFVAGLRVFERSRVLGVLPFHAMLLLLLGCTIYSFYYTLAPRPHHVPCLLYTNASSITKVMQQLRCVRDNTTHGFVETKVVLEAILPLLLKEAVDVSDDDSKDNSGTESDADANTGIVSDKDEDVNVIDDDEEDSHDDVDDDEDNEEDENDDEDSLDDDVESDEEGDSNGNDSDEDEGKGEDNDVVDVEVEVEDEDDGRVITIPTETELGISVVPDLNASEDANEEARDVRVHDDAEGSSAASSTECTIKTPMVMIVTTSLEACESTSGPGPNA